MRRSTWHVDENGSRHEVVLNWSYFGGKRELVVDGQVVSDQRRPVLWWSEQPFQLDGQPCKVVTRPQNINFAKFEVELLVGDRLIRPQSEAR
jgi:hypothetical protein